MHSLDYFIDCTPVYKLRGKGTSAKHLCFVRPLGVSETVYLRLSVIHFTGNIENVHYRMYDIHRNVYTVYE